MTIICVLKEKVLDYGDDDTLAILIFSVRKNGEVRGSRVWGYPLKYLN